MAFTRFTASFNESTLLASIDMLQQVMERTDLPPAEVLQEWKSRVSRGAIKLHPELMHYWSQAVTSAFKKLMETMKAVVCRQREVFRRLPEAMRRGAWLSLVVVLVVLVVLVAACNRRVLGARTSTRQFLLRAVHHRGRAGPRRLLSRARGAS